MKVGVANVVVSMLRLLNEVLDWTSFGVLASNILSFNTKNKAVLSLNQDCIHCYVVLSNVIAMYVYMYSIHSKIYSVELCRIQK